MNTSGRPESLRVGVVGGGIAGLSAAWRLASFGARGVVYEAAERPGGRITTEPFAVPADTSVQFLPGSQVRALALAREVGLGKRLQRAPGRDALWRQGRAHAMELGSALVMAKSRALPAGLKLRLMTRYLPFLARRRGSLDAGEVRRAPADLDGESAAAWGRRELGDDFVDLLAEPLLAATHGVSADETSAAYLHALTAAGLDLTLYALAGGMAEFPRAAATQLASSGFEIQVSSSVSRVERAGRQWRIVSTHGADEVDAVVLAVPPAVLPALIEIPEPLGDWLARITTRPTGSLALELARRPAADFFGLTFPQAESGGVAAVCVQSRKHMTEATRARGRAESADDDADALVVFPRPALAATFAAGDPRDAFARVQPTLRAAFPGLDATLRRVKLRVFETGYTLVPPGAGAHLRAFDPDWLPFGLALAGDYLCAPNVEGAVRSGEAAARRVLGR